MKNGIRIALPLFLYQFIEPRFPEWTCTSIGDAVIGIRTHRNSLYILVSCSFLEFRWQTGKTDGQAFINISIAHTHRCFDHPAVWMHFKHQLTVSGLAIVYRIPIFCTDEFLQIQRILFIWQGWIVLIDSFGQLILFIGE